MLSGLRYFYAIFKFLSSYSLIYVLIYSISISEIVFSADFEETIDEDWVIKFPMNGISAEWLSPNWIVIKV